MTYGVYRAFIAPFSLVALVLAANPAFAGSAAVHGGAFAGARSMSHPSVARSFGHHRGRAFWPGAGGLFYGPDGFYGLSDGEPLADLTPPTSGDIHYTYTYDVPWDWAHRYPPMVVPSERPYVPSCPEEAVTVGRAGGKEQTVNVMRCY